MAKLPMDFPEPNAMTTAFHLAYSPAIAPSDLFLFGDGKK
jgi:hypothetical protein